MTEYIRYIKIICPNSGQKGCVPGCIHKTSHIYEGCDSKCGHPACISIRTPEGREVNRKSKIINDYLCRESHINIIKNSYSYDEEYAENIKRIENIITEKLEKLKETTRKKEIKKDIKTWREALKNVKKMKDSNIRLRNYLKKKNKITEDELQNFLGLDKWGNYRKPDEFYISRGIKSW